MRVATLLLATVVALGCTGCQRQESADTTHQDVQQITGAWYLVEGTVDGDAIDPDPLRRVTLVMDPQGTGDARELAGFSGCNWYGVGLDYTAAALDVGTFSSTAMGCAEDSGRVERLFQPAMADVDQAAQETNSLVLKGSQSFLRFAPIPRIDMDGVVGRRWVLDATVEGDVDVA